MSEIYYGMRGVEDLLHEIVSYGVDVPNKRTGVGTRAIFDAKIILQEGLGFDFVTNRLASPRPAFEEFWFFLRGETDTHILEAKGVNFWKGNTTREFLDARGLEYLNEGDIGAAYSQQWRNFGGYDELHARITGSGRPPLIGGNEGVDQLKRLIDGLRDDLYGRRHVVTLWNPLEEHLMPLTPCHHTMQVVVLPNRLGGNTLSLKLINRSLDTAFGCVFALYQYRMFQMALCKMFDASLGSLSLDLSHVHVYDNQLDYIDELLGREYSDEESSLFLKKDIRTLDDLLELEWSDWDMRYKYNDAPFKTPRPPMVA